MGNIRAISSFVFNIKYFLRSYVSMFPSLYFPIVRFVHGGSKRIGIVDKSTDIVIEGYPRSANTFAFNAFLLANKKHFKIGHHLHSSSQVISGVRRGIPVIVLIREPVDAITSFIIREPRLYIGLAIMEYVRFYSSILAYLDSCVVACFNDVINDFGSVINRVNLKYGKDFKNFENNSESVKACFELIESQNIDKPSRGQTSESLVARPSKERDVSKEIIKSKLLSPKYRKKLLLANHLYQKISGVGQ